VSAAVWRESEPPRRGGRTPDAPLKSRFKSPPGLPEIGEEEGDDVDSATSIRSIGVCGIGQMGSGAAVCYKRAGYRVLLWDQDERKLDSARGRLDALESWLDDHVGPPSASGGEYRLAADLREIDDEADLAMDCIVEDMDRKVQLLLSLAGAVRRKALFITTTSGLGITRMGRESGTSELLVGTHFWNPPHLMPLVEVVRGENTPAEVVDRVVALIESIGKIPVRVNRDVPGFIGNRLLHALWREAIHLVQTGVASPEDVDRVARLTFGLRALAVGPLENMDLVGLDLIKRIHEYLLADLSAASAPLEELERLVERQDLGVKTGKGFYDWRVRDGKEAIDRRDRQIVRQLAFLKELEDR